MLAFLAVLCSLSTTVFSTNPDTLYVTPNPFDSATVIHFDIAQNDTVSLFVYNLLGVKVRTFYENAFLQSGSYAADFVADTLPNAVYVVILQINSTSTLSRLAVHAPVGIGDDGVQEQCRALFPNPTAGFLNIPYDGMKNVIVTDFQGHVLRNLETEKKSVWLGDLSNGVYLVTIVSDNGKIISTQKVVLIK